ncbi:MAG: aminopeptidase P N-terminal domain-containing protein [Candidatus Saccharimonadales bacterium]
MQSSFFHANRQRFSRVIEGGVAVLTAYSSMQRTNDAAFEFEQEANLWWLSGIEAPDWWLIIDGTRGKSWLVSPTISSAHQVFDGSLSSDEAKSISAVDDILTHDQAMTMLRDLAKKHSVVYSLGEQPHAQYLDFTLNPAPKKLHELLERTFQSVQDCRKDLAKLRAIKQPDEITAIKKAIQLTIAGFESVKQQLSDYRYEYQIEAEFSYLFRKNGAVGHAYDPIVAGGKNACTLHYVANSDRLKKRELLLLDIGARVNGYAADITRTYSLREPTARQRDVHGVVQAAHRQIIKLLQPDLPVEQYYQQVEQIMKHGLISLGLMTDVADQANYQKYFPHAISHGLGVDVHDSLGGPTHFQPGMVLTVEPGIYIPEESIGVRIEDDILITATGHINLSRGLSTDS